MVFGVSWEVLAVAVVAGIGIGSVVSLVSQGLALIYSTTGYFSFAPGVMISFGALLSYALSSEASWPVAPTILVIVLSGFVLGMISYVLCVLPVGTGRKDAEVMVLFTTIGFTLAVESLLHLEFGSEIHPVPNFISSKPIFVGSVAIRPIHIVLALVAVVFGVAFEVFLRRTDIGLTMRAAQQDSEGARLLGVHTRQIVFWIFGISGAMATLSGFLVAPIFSASPYIGTGPFLLAFAALALGGFSSFGGALVSGAAIGLVSMITPLYTEPAMARPAVLAIVIVVLLIRPNGLFQGGKARLV